MRKNLKHYVYKILNGMILKPFDLTVSYRIGRDPLDDLNRLFGHKQIELVIDGGAYHGDFSINVLSRFPAATVYAFEPQKDSFLMLSKRVSNFSRIHPINLALGEKSGEGILYTNISPMTNSLSKSTNDALRYFRGYNEVVGEEYVTVTALNDFVLKLGIKGIDILKLDLQGHELNAIRGLRQHLVSVKAIFVEVEFMRLYENAPIFSQVDTFLSERDFQLFQFYDLVRSPDNGRLLYGDALFLNSNDFPL